MHGSRGCLGCCTGTQPRLLIAVNEPSNRLRIQGRSARKNSISEDFWSTSTMEMENSGVQSQKSISSVSTSNPVDSHGTSGSTSNTPEFVNHGLLLWNQTRSQWLANRSQHQTQLREPRISWNATYESLLSTNKPFRQPIPLPEMIDFLVDIWEQEGLYDWSSKAWKTFISLAFLAQLCKFTRKSLNLWYWCLLKYQLLC